MEEKKLTDEVVVAKNAITDEEIVKALEMNCLCVVYGKENCESCLLFEKDCRILPNAVVDLIHRQKAEIERLTEYNENLNGMCLEFIDKNAELQKQVDELKRELEKAYETERANIRAEIADAGTSCHWCERQTVKDTAKEIYEKAKNKSVTAYVSIDENPRKDKFIFLSDLENIVREKGVEVE